MSFEDAELKDILAQTLESNGSLAKIRAQLRSCIYLAFDEDELMHKKQPLMNNKIQQKLETPVGKLMFKVVREFLEFLDLDYTISVYDSESYMGKEYDYEGRSDLLKDLNLDANESVPVLYELIKQAQAKSAQVKQQNGESDSTFDMTSPTVQFDSPQPSEVINPEKSTKPMRTILDSTINDFPFISKLSPQKLKNRSILGEKTNGAELINRNSNYIVGEDNYEEDFMSERELKSDHDLDSQDFEVDSNNVEDILQSK
ncbi:PREDICTED: FGFR1 oncogene partner-like [Nicrophorus vespilloides]|uniref:FGFR1 oncogene partner-like n=1 Tax=Nicrophorus vespilloides TaxID=110193 RepID=A0ABM1NHK3_NICVS|nr:PREDICTED: FGFR1 oncogene partner-like [Nicrophorus vespilloides]